MTSYNRILGYDRFTGSWNNIACNSTGALYVTGLTGGSGSGDASAENQVLQLEQAQESNIALFNQLETQTDRLLYDLDVIANRLHDISGTVTIDNQISGFSTESKQDTLITETQNSNVAQYGQLAIIAEAGEISTSYLQGISTKLSGLPRGTASYTLDAKTTLAPDTVPSYSVPPNGIPASDGWYYKNLVLGNTSQLYYYANIATQTKNYDYQIAAVQSQFAVVRILSLNATAGLPFLAVYSQPTGSGDAVPGFYKSRWVYTIGSTQELRLGEQVMIYRGVAPDSRIYPNVRRVECVLSGTVGPANNLEILAYATLNTESGAAVGNAEYIVKGAGLTFAGDHIYEVELTGESDSGSTGGATESKQDTQITTAQQSNTAICVRLDKNTYTASNLHVRDDSLKSSMESQFTNLNSVIGQGLYINMDSDPVISGGVKLRGLTDGNLFVYDTRAESKLIDCITELQSVNGTLTNLADGTQQLWVHTSSADDSIEIHGYNPVLQMPEAIHTVDNSAKVYVNNTLTVTETNPISGFALETTQSDIKTSVDQLKTFLLDSHLEVTNLNNISNYATETTLDSIKLAVQGTLSTQITNPVSISGGVEISNQPTVNLASGSTVGLAYGSQIQLINSEVSLVSGTQVGVSNFPSQQSVSVDNQPTVNLAYGSQVQSTNVPGQHLDCYIVNTDQGSTLNVNVQNTPSVSISSGTVSLAYGSQIQLINSEVSLVSGTQVGISNFPYSQLINGSVSVDNFPQKQSVFIENTTEGFDINTHITNTSLAVTGDFYPVSQTVTGTVDTHMYANGSGGSMHLVSCDNQGNLNICLHDNSGNGITSTTDGTKQALDVKLSSNPTLSASSSDILIYGFDSTGSANRKLSVDSSGALNAVVSTTNGTAVGVKSVKYGSWGNVYNNQASILPSGVSSSIDVSNWAYFMGWYQDSTTGSGTGSIYLEYSFDNITFYRIFNTMIVPSGSGTRTANITKQDLGGIKYIRMNNATTQTLSSVTLTLFGASN